jgi:D-3-phosphoglycerate dehydrogenase / 2-oxoglutarate reductase
VAAPALTHVLVPLRAQGGLAEQLRGQGFDVVEVDVRDREQVAARLPTADIFVTTPAARFVVDAELLATAPRLRAVNSLVIGVEMIDVDACSEAGVIVANGAVPENYLGMAEATVLLMLALGLELKAKERAVREGGFRPATNGASLLGGKTVGLVGLGRIGRSVAERLQGFGVRILAHDPYLGTPDDADPRFARASLMDHPPPVTPANAPPRVTLVGLDELLRRSDIVSVHVPLTKQTRGLLGAEELSMMRPSAYLLNTARGGVVDEQALADALNAGRIAGAGVDTWAEEPAPRDNPLFGVDPDKLILTGHCLGHTAKAPAALAEGAVANVVHEARGELPPYVVNPGAEGRWRARLAELERRAAPPQSLGAGSAP